MALDVVFLVNNPRAVFSVHPEPYHIIVADIEPLALEVGPIVDARFAGNDDVIRLGPARGAPAAGSGRVYNNPFSL